MAGRPILRAYLEQVENLGVQNILNRISEGDSIAAVARSMGVSRSFLSTFLNSTAEGVECLALARELAAAVSPRSKGSGTHSEVYGWAQTSARPRLNDWMAARLSLSHSGPRGAEKAQSNHLAALQQLHIERLGESQPQPPPKALRLPYTSAPS